MCLTIASSWCVAQEEIPVYKVLLGNRSPYHDFEYEPNKTYHQELEFSTDCKKVFAGFHSYRTLKAAEELIWWLKAAKELIWCMQDEPLQGYEPRIVKLFIPEGSEYYYGDDDDIVSDSIRTDDLYYDRYWD